MSILSAISNAAQTLRNTETQISIASDNIGNAQNPDYVRQVTTTVDLSGGGQVVDVSQAVNQSLQQGVLTATAAESGSSTLSQVYTQLEQLTGSASETPALMTAVQDLVTAFQNYATTPGSTETQQAAQTAASNLVQTVQTVSTGIETIANQLQSQTETDVKTLNSDPTKIAQLNGQIVSAQSSGSRLPISTSNSIRR